MYYLPTVSDCDLEIANQLEEVEAENVKKLIESGRSKLYHPSAPVQLSGPLHAVLSTCASPGHLLCCAFV